MRGQRKQRVGGSEVRRFGANPRIAIRRVSLRRSSGPPILRSLNLFAWRFRTAFVFVFLTVGCNSFPAWAINDKAGTKNGNFLKIATDARGVALGDSAVSMARGIDAVRWNPAALSKLETKEFSGTHIQYYQDIRIENAGFAYPLEESALAVNALYLSPGTLDGRDIQGIQTGDFKFYDLVGSLSYGRKMLSRAEGMETSIGATLKIVQETIADQQVQNPALDLGVLVSPLENLDIGVTLRNFSSSKANFAREILGGASYTFFRSFTGAFAVNYSNDAPLRASFGSEYRVPQYNTAVRLGYETRDTLDASQDSKITFLRSGGLGGLTMGAGFEYPLPLANLRLQLDYAMAPFGILGISHTVTLKVKW